MRRVTLLYQTHNRLEYTKVSFETLLKNTEWEYVQDFVLFDDSSTDGTQAFLEEHDEEIRMRVYPANYVRVYHVGGNVNVAVNTLRPKLRTDFFAKIDNDILIEDPCWVSAFIRILDQFKACCCVAGWSWPVPPDALDKMIAEGQGRLTGQGFGYVLPSHVGGNFMLRTKVLQECGPIPIPGKGTVDHRFHGWGYHQHALRRAGYDVGYAYPAVKLIHMDEPGHPLSRTVEYAQKGWGRDWERIYKEDKRKAVPQGA